MELRLIRSATLRFNYAGRQFLADPYLAPKFSRPTYGGRSLNPLADLPCPPQEVIAGIEWTMLSHLHSDHFDPAAQELLPKETLILCQPGDEARIREKGFQSVTPIPDSILWQGIKITRTSAQHGSGDVLKDMGNASGFVFQAEGEPTVYWVGDSVWTPEVAGVIERVQPKIIITHSCGALWGDGVLIVMDAEQTVTVCRAAPASKVIAIHMESVDHGTVSRAALREYAEANGIRADQLLIPADGERMTF